MTAFERPRPPQPLTTCDSPADPAAAPPLAADLDEDHCVVTHSLHRSTRTAGPRPRRAAACRHPPAASSATTGVPPGDHRGRAPIAARHARAGPRPTVGDWLAIREPDRCAGRPRIEGVLARTSLLRRMTADGGGAQALAANVDVVLITCGLDRPLRAGRIHRAAAQAWDAGAQPVLVLTKAEPRVRCRGRPAPPRARAPGDAGRS